jgi:hypothetical protein
LEYSSEVICRVYLMLDANAYNDKFFLHITHATMLGLLTTFLFFIVAQV